MPRFYCPNAELESSEVEITDKNEIHHLKNVLRLKAGSPINIFNGKGKEAKGVISKLTNTTVMVSVKSVIPQSQRNTRIILACALPKKAKFEFIIEKCTELGVDEIIPLITQRTEVSIKKDKEEAKLKRFEKIAVNAAKQCRRATVPLIHEFQNLPTALEKFGDSALKLIPCLSEKQNHLTKVLPKIKKHKEVAFFIGPEGDFTPKEITFAKQQGCLSLSLGETVLKVDTAAVFVIGAAQLTLSS